MNAGATVDDLASGDERSSIVVGRFSADSQVREGEAADVAVDTRAIHFFDAETGTAIYEEGATR